MPIRPFDLPAVIKATEAREAAAEQLRLANEQGNSESVRYWKGQVAKADREVLRAGGPLP